MSYVKSLNVCIEELTVCTFLLQMAIFFLNFFVLCFFFKKIILPLHSTVIVVALKTYIFQTRFNIILVPFLVW